MQQYFRYVPLTASLLLCNLIVFLGYHLRLVPLSIMLARPGEIGLHSFLAHISHTDMLHIAANMVIFSHVGALLERRMGRPVYAACLMALWILIVLMGQPFLTYPALGFSGILMGLLVLTAWVMRRYPDVSQQMVVLLVLNILVGLLPGISFLMHAMGAVAGVVVIGLLILSRTGARS